MISDSYTVQDVRRCKSQSALSKSCREESEENIEILSKVLIATSRGCLPSARMYESDRHCTDVAAPENSS